MAIIDIQDLSFSYGTHQVLKDLNFQVEAGDLVVLLGENGSGKSTLLKIILGELTKNAGNIDFFGTPVEKFQDFERIGYVPQLRVADSMSFPVNCKELVVQNRYKHFGFIKIPDRKSKAMADDILDEMGLSAYKHTPVNQLSGGLKQRTMIARALINQPELLILDEPTAGVDQESKEHLSQLILEMSRERKITLVLVTHELDFLEKDIDNYKVYRLKEGKIQDVSL